MDAFKAFRDHRLHAEKRDPLSGPVAGGAGAVFLTGDDHLANAFGLILHRRVVDPHLFTGRDVCGPGAFGAGSHFVFEANVSERAADHDFMVAAAGPVAVEVRLLHALFDEILGGGGILGDVTGRRDMVGGDGVT